MRVEVNRKLLDWAIARSKRDVEVFGKYDWAFISSPIANPTIGQLENFAKDARVPLGYLFLEKPPVEQLPIADFRKMPTAADRVPSPELLDTIHLCQRRQVWYREYVDRHGIDKPRFVGSLEVKTSTNEAAGSIRDWLKFGLEDRDYPTWTEALSDLIHRSDDSGVLVMVNSVVGNNTHRKLDPREFRGFAISDPLAPLIFVNASDTKSAQMFTIIHELAHIWLGSSAVSNADPKGSRGKGIEQWCDAVAGEFLVPETILKQRIVKGEALEDTMARLSRSFKVSSLVVLRRLFDIEVISQKTFWETFDEELNRLKKAISEKKSGGGDFYRTSSFRVSRRFATALLSSTLEGETLYGDAMRLLSLSSSGALEEYAERLGVG